MARPVVTLVGQGIGGVRKGHQGPLCHGIASSKQVILAYFESLCLASGPLWGQNGVNMSSFFKKGSETTAAA